jgi:large subunit ribosomal protein L10
MKAAADLACTLHRQYSVRCRRPLVGRSLRFDPKCPYENDGRPAQVNKSVVEASGFWLPFAAVRARGFLVLDGQPALRSAADVARDEVEETMARSDKVAAVAELASKFSGSAGVVLTEYRGLSVKALMQLRRSLGDDASYAVSKNTLTTIAAREAGLDAIEEQLVGPTAIAFINGDPVVVAKGLRDFARTNPQLVIKGGVLDGKFMTPDEVRKLADLESREVLLAKVAGVMQGVLQQAISLVSAPLSQAARLFAALEQAAGENPSLLAPAPEASAEPSNEEPAADFTQEPTTAEPAEAVALEATTAEPAAEVTLEPAKEELAAEVTREPTNEELAAEAALHAASAAPDPGTAPAAEPLAAPAAEDN